MKTTLIALTVLLFGAGGCVKLKAQSAQPKENHKPAVTQARQTKIAGRLITPASGSPVHNR